MSSASSDANRLLFLTPEGAHREQALKYVLVGSLTAIVWDIITNTRNDQRLLYKHKVALPTMVYFFARMSTLVYVLLCTLFEFVPFRRCDVVEDFIAIFLSLAVPPSTLQFFFRIRAIFDQHRLVVRFFFILWFGALACCMVAIGSLRGVNIGSTDYCETAPPPPYIASPGFGLLVFDTLACVATTGYLLSRFAPQIEGGTSSRLWVLFCGQNIPGFTRTLLRNGQIYFIITAMGNLTCVIIILVANGPSFVALVVPNVVLTNTMASYVFRSTKLSTEDDLEIQTSVNTQPLAFRRTGFSDGCATVDNIELPVVYVHDSIA